MRYSQRLFGETLFGLVARPTFYRQFVGGDTEAELRSVGSSPCVYNKHVLGITRSAYNFLPRTLLTYSKKTLTFIEVPTELKRLKPLFDQRFVWCTRSTCELLRASAGIHLMVCPAMEEDEGETGSPDKYANNAEYITEIGTI